MSFCGESICFLRCVDAVKEAGEQRTLSLDDIVIGPPIESPFIGGVRFRILEPNEMGGECSVILDSSGMTALNPSGMPDCRPYPFQSRGDVFIVSPRGAILGPDQVLVLRSSLACVDSCGPW
jgi:hypothetical protein